MLTLLIAALLAAGIEQKGTPTIVIADEHREGGDPTEVKIVLTNNTDMIIHITFKHAYHGRYFGFRVYDEGGRPLDLPRPTPRPIGGPSRVVALERGESATGYHSPRHCFQIPPGRYQISVVYRYRPFGGGGERQIESNRIFKTFP
jgi:hypothetical protein